MTTEPTAATDLIGERVNLAGHFQEPVTVEGVRPLGSSVELQVRRGDGQLDETILSTDEVDALLAQLTTQAGPAPLADPHPLRLLVESARIRLAYAYDRHFAVSLSGIRTLPHHGDDDRFGHFVRLIDPDVFPEPHRLGEQARAIRRDILNLAGDSPWALRRLKEGLRDLEGRRLFPDRHAHTVTFQLNAEEFALYKAVTSYINEFLPRGVGRQAGSVALTRTVLQRRLASSTRAIHESLRRRLEKQQRLLEELEALSPQERARYLERPRGRLTDEEQDEDDLDEVARDRLTDEFTAAVEMEQLRMEVAALRDLAERARRVRDRAPDSKLAALRECLARADTSATLSTGFGELQDGRGNTFAPLSTRLLIFTEHRDTLAHLREHLERWGYTTCEIHGGMNPHQRKAAQEEFRTQRQICVATEAAGEGINLQFCHLMINYDLPWNPTRLEQRMGRIHRIGQERDVYVFNFVAEQAQDGQPVVEGRILKWNWPPCEW